MPGAVKRSSPLLGLQTNNSTRSHFNTTETPPTSSLPSYHPLSPFRFLSSSPLPYLLHIMSTAKVDTLVIGAGEQTDQGAAVPRWK